MRGYLSTLAVACLGMAVLLSGSSCRSRLSLAHGPCDSREWAVAGGEAGDQGRSPERPILPLALSWKVRTRGSVVASPLVIGDLVCVGTLGKRFYFLSTADGRRCGTMKTDAGISAAAAAGEGSVFLVTEGDEGLVYALDVERGEIRWRTTVGDVSAGLAYHQGCLLVSTNMGQIYGLAAADGSQRWRYSTRGMRTTAVTVIGEMAVCGCDRGRLYVLDIEEGVERWSRQLEGAVWSRPSAGDGCIYAGTFEGYLYCLQADDGEIIWRRKLDGGVTRPPALNDEMLFVGTDRGLIVAFDRHSGEPLWRQRLTDARPGTPLATSEALFVGGSDGRLRALSLETGELLWSHQAGGDIVSAPAIRKGRLYIGSRDDLVFAFGPAGAETTATASSGTRPAGRPGSPNP